MSRARLRARLGTLALVSVAALAGPARSPAQSTHLLVVTGLGGDPAYSATFARWGAGLVAAAVDAGVPAENVVWLAESADAAAGVTGAARRDRVAQEVARIGERSGSGDVVAVVLFGHGSARGAEVRLALPGPDLTATDLDAWLDPLESRRVVVVNAASASGGFLAPLSAPGRVVVTATRSAGEAEATRFGGHFVAALRGEADTDKDGRVTVLEAFEYARREVAREFAEAGHLPTEHALIDDNGDGRGSLEPGEEDGARAARIALAPDGTAAVADDPPAIRALRAEQARLETELEALRSRRESMAPAAYDAELERLLLEIARVGRAIREAGSGSDGGGP